MNYEAEFDERAAEMERDFHAHAAPLTLSGRLENAMEALDAAQDELAKAQRIVAEAVQDSYVPRRDRLHGLIVESTDALAQALYEAGEAYNAALNMERGVEKAAANLHASTLNALGLGGAA